MKKGDLCTVDMDRWYGFGKVARGDLVMVLYSVSNKNGRTCRYYVYNQRAQHKHWIETKHLTLVT